MNEYNDAFANGYFNYKDIKIRSIKGIYIENFRTIKDKKLDLGKNITIISGKNGTMKSCLLGLIAHPFSSPNNAIDSFGFELKTDMREVFNLSIQKDTEKYNYYLNVETSDNIIFSEPIRIYLSSSKDRHRVTVGKDNKKGKGNFSLNTTYINLKRLFPILNTSAEPVLQELSSNQVDFISKGYLKILQKNSFTTPSLISDKVSKHTFGPSDDANYDFKSISSGEDNLGHILNKMYAFLEYRSSNIDNLQGIFCLDEFEASLHPVAQINLFEFILNWSINNNIQVVISTHSLYLIQYALLKQQRLQHDQLIINIISTAFVNNYNYNIIKNPSYEEAYKELTYKDADELCEVYKINILCEDDIAEYIIRRIISKRSIIQRLNFIHSLSSDSRGNSCSSLKSLIKNGELLLANSIIVFDPEVPITDIKSKVSFLKLPSNYNFPIEKEIVKYIFELPGDDKFFLKYNKERDSFINDFSKYDITNLLNLDSISRDSVKKYKSWAKSDSNFKQYITYYIKNSQGIISPFQNKLIDEINKKLLKKSLPQIFL